MTDISGEEESAKLGRKDLNILCSENITGARMAANVKRRRMAKGVASRKHPKQGISGIISATMRNSVDSMYKYIFGDTV
jgi:hypothetical protein